jgi:CO/xanthine dehydrogenase Mo-binding subunit
VGGNAVRVAAGKIRRVLDLAAADLLHCKPAQLTRAGEAYVGPSEEPVAWERVVDHARRMGLQLSTEGRWEMPVVAWDFEHGHGEPYVCYVFGAQVAEVEVSVETGRTRVTGFWAAHDAGTIIYPQGALGQMYGGIAQGLGYALLEDFQYRDAVPQRLSLAHYHVPRATDVPEIKGTFIQTHFRAGPFGAKNLAEPVMVGAAPAIANAVFHATGQRIRRLPLTPQRIKAACAT